MLGTCAAPLATNLSKLGGADTPSHAAAIFAFQSNVTCGPHSLYSSVVWHEDLSYNPAGDSREVNPCQWDHNLERGSAYWKVLGILNTYKLCSSLTPSCYTKCFILGAWRISSNSTPLTAGDGLSQGGGTDPRPS